MRREWRLRHRADFQRVRQDGRTLRQHPLMVSLTSNSTGQNRYGFIVSKQIGNAVIRNRVRRRLREIIRLLHPQLKHGFDVVFIARAGIAEQPFVDVQRIVIELTRRANLLQESIS